MCATAEPVTGASNTADETPRAGAGAPARVAPPRSRGPGALARAAAFALPFAGAVSQTRGEALFRSDAAILAALDGQAGFQGMVSTLLGQLCLLLPLGNHAFRLAVGGAVFAGVAGLCVLLLCHSLFRKQGGYSRLDSWLSLGASLSVSLSLPWMSEATVAGGAAAGAGIALCLILQLVTVGFPRSIWAAGLGGCLWGALWAETAWCAGLVVLSALVCWPESSHLRGEETPLRRALAIRLAVMLACAAATAAVCFLPALTSQSTTVLDAWSRSAAQSASPWPVWSPLAWIGSVGFLWTGGAIIATLFALADRRPVVALAIWIVADVLAPGIAHQGWTQAVYVDQSRISLHLVGLAMVGPLGALGLRTLGETAQALRLFAARPLAAMVAAFAIAGCLASAEDSLRTLSRTQTRGAQTWTGEALDFLSDDALVLTKSPAWGARLLAAQALGQRPDVLVVPLGEVSRPETLRLWLEREPALELLLRDLSITDTPSERAVTRLVDRRPVYLEADPSWDQRLLEHLLPTLPLATFSSHAVGRSDRLAAMENVPGPVARIHSAAEDGLVPDQATRAVLASGFAQSLEALEAIDRKSMERLDELNPQKPKEQNETDEKAAPLAAL